MPPDPDAARWAEIDELREQVRDMRSLIAEIYELRAMLAALRGEAPPPVPVLH